MPKIITATKNVDNSIEVVMEYNPGGTRYKIDKSCASEFHLNKMLNWNTKESFGQWLNKNKIKPKKL